MVGSPGGDFGELAAFAEEVRAAVEPVPDHPEVGEERERVLGLARALGDRVGCEVAFGVFAESSAGKSLLLGALVGNPSLLPVETRTVTCNITELRLRHAAVRVARVVAARAEYLDHDEIRDYIDHLVRHTGNLVRAADGDVGALRELTPDWSGLFRLRQVLDSSARLRLAPNALDDLRREVDEMLKGERALRASGLAPGSTEELLTPDGVVDTAALWALVDHGTAAGPADRQAVVRRVVAEVEVPAGVWSSARLYGAAVRLVDVPGSRGSRKPVRDEYLRVRELDEVDTALFFLDSRPGSTHESRALQDLMIAGRRDLDRARDAILVVAGKFDAVPEVPGVLLDEPRVEPEEEAVLGRSAVLRELVTAARDLVPSGRDDRIFFVSPYVTMANAGELDLGWDVDGEIARLRAGQEVALARDKVERWRRVGRVPGRLGDGLAAFTTDGGLDALRTGMIRHAAEHGVTQALDRVRTQADELRSAFERLKRRRADLGPVPVEDDDVRRLVERVFGTIRDRVAQARSALSQRLADPESAPRTGKAPAERVREEAERTVADWPEWKALFDAVADGRVQADSATDLPEEYRDLLDDAPLPVLVSEFSVLFRKACDRVDAGHPDVVAERVETYLDECGLVTQAERELIDEVLTPAVRARLGAERGGGALLVAVGQFTRPHETARDVCARLKVESEAGDRHFPLDPTRALPWHPDSPRRGSESYTGIGQVLRLRQSMTEAVVVQCRGTLAVALAAAAKELDGKFRGMSAALNLINNNAVRWIDEITRARRTDGSEETDR